MVQYYVIICPFIQVAHRKEFTVNSLAILILTKNEEINIVDVVQNAKKCTDEVIVIDSGSTDRTVELAKEQGAKVAFRAWDDDFAAQRNFALEQTGSDWVLYLDADERLNDELIAAIHQILENGDMGAQYGMKRNMVFNGYHFHHGIFAPDTVYRMFPRTQVKWVSKVHEHPECPLDRKILQGNIEHYTYNSWHQWLMKADYYTTIWAEERYQQGKRVTLGTAFLHASLGTLRALLIKGAFLDGWMGIISCVQHGFYTMLKYVKLYELQMRNKGKKR